MHASHRRSLVIATAALAAAAVVAGCGAGRELAVENDTQVPLIVIAHSVETDGGFRVVRPGTTAAVFEGGLEMKYMPDSITVYDTFCTELGIVPTDDPEGGLVILKGDGSIVTNWAQRLPGSGVNVVANSTCADAAATAR